MAGETPCAEPHAGCCGGWRLETSGYPIMPEYSQGVGTVGAAILKNGEQLTIDQVLSGLMNGEKATKQSWSANRALSAINALCWNRKGNDFSTVKINDLKQRFIETANLSSKQKDVEVLNIMTKQGVLFNEYQFIELFLDGRMKGQTTLEVFKIIKKLLSSEPESEEEFLFTDPHGVRMAIYKMDLLVKYIDEKFHDYILVVRKSRSPPSLLLRRIADGTRRSS